MRKSHLIHVFFATIVACGSPNWVNADIIGFGNFSGWKINQVDPKAAPAISVSLDPLQSSIHLTGTDSQENRSIFFKTPQPTSSQFTASFTYQSTGAPDGFSGFAFVLQNSPNTYNATGDNFVGLGYGDISPSVAVAFPLASPFSAGMFLNGAFGAGTDPLGPVDLLSGHPIDVEISYDGSILREFVKDTVTLQTSATGFHVASLPATAYVGLTATNNNSRDQLFSNFQFVTVPEPSSFVLGGLGGLGLLAYVRRRCRVR